MKSAAFDFKTWNDGIDTANNGKLEIKKIENNSTKNY